MSFPFSPPMSPSNTPRFSLATPLCHSCRFLTIIPSRHQPQPTAVFVHTNGSASGIGCITVYWLYIFCLPFCCVYVFTNCLFLLLTPCRFRSLPVATSGWLVGTAPLVVLVSFRLPLPGKRRTTWSKPLKQLEPQVESVCKRERQ